MFQLYGTELPRPLHEVRIGGLCPHCNQGSRFTMMISPDYGQLRQFNASSFVASYACELCLGPIPILWHVVNWTDQGHPRVGGPRHVLPARELFDFDHVPDLVKVEVDEALNCLSVNAYNGFAALCRRCVQAICTDLGTTGSTKVKRQIEDMMSITGLSAEWQDLALQIMLTGHDGAHPHLPEVGQERAAVLLSLLKDLVYELYTRPGKVKKAASLRQQSIASGQTSGQ